MSKINEMNKDFDIVELNEDAGLTITSKKNAETVTVYDKEMIEKIIEKNFEKRYKKILYQIMLYNEDDSSDDSYAITLAIDEFRRYLITKYYKYLNGYKLNQYLNMITALEGEININKKRGGR